MKKKLLCIVLALLMCVSLLPTMSLAAEATAYNDIGAGTKDDPYLIGNLAQLKDLAYKSGTSFEGKYFKLTADIEGLTFPIGTGDGGVGSFPGYFDGAGHTVTLNMPSVFVEKNGGLFTTIASSGTVTNVNVEGTVCMSEDSIKPAGGICGRNDGTITNCSSSVTVTTSTGVAAGGICGANLSGKVTNCSSSATVTGNGYAGGICGMSNGVIANCFSSGSVTATGDTGYAGGICGRNDGTITNCFSSATVTANGTDYAGGVCGNATSSLVSHCYYHNEIFAGNGVGDSYNATLDTTGLTTGQMTAASGTSGALVDLLNGYAESAQYPNGWFLWDNTEGKYPEFDIHTHDGVIFVPWNSSDCLPDTAGSWYLTDDVTITKTWTVPAGTTDLDLNGHVIKLALSPGHGSVSVIMIRENNTLNLYDCDTMTPHYFSDNGGLWVLGDEAAEHTVYGGVITGGDATNGGGVYLRDAETNVTFNLYGGSIVGNRAGTGGGGVSLQSNEKVFNMYGGLIAGNTSGNYSGGVQASGYDIYVNLYGGEISNNKTVNTSGGVGLYEGHLTVGGTAVVKNNKAGIAANDIDYNPGNNNASTAKVGTDEYAPALGMQVGLAALVNGSTIKNAVSGQEKFFFADNDSQYVAFNHNGTDGDTTDDYLELCDIPADNYRITTMPAKHGAVNAVPYAAEGESVNISIASDRDYQLDTLTVTDADGAPVALFGRSFTMPAKNVTVTATFRYAPVIYISTYAVTTERAEHGSVSADKKSAYSGSTVTLTAAPEKGWTVETVTVTGKNGKSVEVKNLGDNKFSFRMPEGAVTVTATFMEDNTMLNFCVDVKASDCFYDPVLWSYLNEITMGVDNVHFGPYLDATRAQVVTFLYRIAQKNGEGFTGAWVFPLTYTDADQIPDYAYEAIAWCSMKGIVNGYDTGDFGPNDNVTREQLAVMLYQFALVMGEQGFTGDWFFPLNFSDAAYVSPWASEAMHWCVMKQIISGRTDGTLDPQGLATRAEIITIFYRFCDKVLEK